MPDSGLAETADHPAVHVAGVLQLAFAAAHVQEHLRKGDQRHTRRRSLVHQAHRLGMIGLKVLAGGHLREGDFARAHGFPASNGSGPTGSLARILSRLAGVEVIVR